MSAQARTGRAERVLAAVAGAAAAVGAAALAGIFVLVLAAVVMRYGWSRPFPFTEELAGLLMTVAVFTLLPLTVLRELHIRVTLLTDKLPGWPKRIVYGVGQLIFLAFCVVFLKEAWAIAAFTQQLNLMSEQSRLPLAPFLWVSTAGVALAGAMGAWRLVRPSAPGPGDEVHP